MINHFQSVPEDQQTMVMPDIPEDEEDTTERGSIQSGQSIKNSLNDQSKKGSIMNMFNRSSSVGHISDHQMVKRTSPGRGSSLVESTTFQSE